VKKLRCANRFVASFFVVCGILAGYSVTACRAPTKVEYSARYFLEVVNEAADSVRIHTHVGGQDFKEIPAGVRRSRYGSGIMALKSRQARAFEMTVFGPRDSPADNNFLVAFSSIHFFAEDSDTPFRSYEYPVGGGCGEGRVGSNCSDDARTYRRHPDGFEERLFVESTDRPFYLERDGEDPELGRIVITFVPDMDAGSVVVAN